MKIVILGNQGRSMVNFWTVLARRMLAAGHAVLCCCPPGDGVADAALRALGAEVRHYPLDRKGLNPLRDVASYRALLRIFRDASPDVLFSSTIKPVIYGCLAARKAGVPQIYATITGLGYAFEADSVFKKCVHRLGVALYRTALRHAEGVFFQNHDDIAVFRESGILQPNARVLTARGTGVDTRRFAVAPLPPAAPFVFLLVGRLLEAKGLREYAAAAALLKEQYPEACFRLLGPEERGPGSIAVSEVEGWQARGHIEYLGAARDVRPHVSRAHVLVLPSWREGTPTAVMEGMSMGRPAIVTDVPGCREVVRDRVNGRMVPARDPAALAAAMRAFLDRPEDVPAMGRAGRELAEREFDAEKVAARILADMRVPDAASACDTADKDVTS